MKDHRLAKIASGLLSVILVSSCGGGGGSDRETVSSAPVAITLDNAEAAAGASAANSQSTYDVGNMGGGIVVGVSAQDARPNFRMAAFARRQLRWVTKNYPPVSPQVVSIVITDDIACGVSGSATVAFDDADNSGGISAGDGFSITFRNCVDDTDQTTMNGVMALRLDSAFGDPGTDLAWDMGMTMTLTNFMVSGGGNSSTIDGDMGFELATGDGVNFSGSIGGNSLAVSVNGVTEILSDYLIKFTSNDATLAYSVDASGTVSSTDLGGSVQFDTLVPFEGVDPDYPHTGVMKITGANGTSVTLKVNDSVNAQLEIDADGDGNSEQSTTTQWKKLDS